MLTIEELEDFYENNSAKKVWVFSKYFNNRTYYLHHLNASTLAMKWTTVIEKAVHFQTESTAKLHKSNYFVNRDDIQIEQVEMEE